MSIISDPPVDPNKVEKDCLLLQCILNVQNRSNAGEGGDQAGLKEQRRTATETQVAMRC